MHDLYLMKLTLRNYCFYEDYTFDFTKPDGSPYEFICFYGPNGLGKSTLLEAILLLTMNRFGRGMDRIRRSLFKYVYNENYNPGLSDAETKPGKNMFVEGVYQMGGKEYVIQLTENGWLRNDFSPVPTISDPTIEDMSEAAQLGPWGEDHLKHTQRICHYVTSDSDLSLNKFQLVTHHMQNFEDIMTEIMRWPAKCIAPPELEGWTSQEDRTYCTDYTITKTKRRTGNQVITHFRRMSAGERKITKSFSDLLNMMYSLEYPEPGEPSMLHWPRLLLIDNIEMHAYFDRHVRLLNCMKRVFSHQQIFATTHSGVLIERAQRNGHDRQEELWFDLGEING